MKTLFLALSLVLGSLGAFGPSVMASDIPMEGAFLCNLHFSDFAYGKEVKSVLAHVGVERNCKVLESANPYWVDIKDVPLAFFAAQNRFTGKAILHFKSSTYQPCDSKPMVQFWINFEDGTSKIEAPITAQVTNKVFVTDCEGDRAAAGVSLVEDFRNGDLAEIDTVSCVEVLSYGDASSRLVESHL